jgi:hypothetical protein
MNYKTLKKEAETIYFQGLQNELADMKKLLEIMPKNTKEYLELQLEIRKNEIKTAEILLEKAKKENIIIWLISFCIAVLLYGLFFLIISKT